MKEKLQKNRTEPDEVGEKLLKIEGHHKEIKEKLHKNRTEPDKMEEKLLKIGGQHK